LLDDCDALHLSGVTPATGPNGAKAALAAVRAARARGMTVSFDGNYRQKLWQAWNGDAPGILRELVAGADIVFADHRDFAVILGLDYATADADRLQERAAAAAFDAFPQLQRIATTTRVQRSVDHHELSAISITRSNCVATQAHDVTQIVDRIGGGDAFAAGVLHGLATGLDDLESLRFGLAAACLKHSIPGDFNLAGIDDVNAFLGERRYDVRR
jgi:2-dehydro-3-deoxygluconokinase